MTSKTKAGPRIEWHGLNAPLFSATDDMDAPSFSLPAGLTCPMMKADSDDDVCMVCYAFINHYQFEPVIRAQLIRFWWTKDRLKDGTFATEMAQQIQNFVGAGYFRGHDSGDFFSLPYIEAWADICRQNPDVKFWFPCRGHHQGAAAWLDAHRKLAGLDNVALRPSALQIDEPAPRIDGFAPGSTVVSAQNQEEAVRKAESLGCLMCPKSLYNTSCGAANCRECWNKEGRDVAYWLHSHNAMHKQIPVDFTKVAARYARFVKKMLAEAARNGLPVDQRKRMEVRLKAFERRLLALN